MDAYLAERRLGQSERTLRTLRTYRAAWSDFAARRRVLTGSEPTLADLSTETVNAYLSDAMASGRWNAQSARTYGASISSVLGALVRHGRLRSNPLAGFERPKADRRAPLYFPEAALRAIFGALESFRTTVNLRLRAFAQIMLDCGARPGEVAGLHFADLDEPGSSLLIRGKGGKERRVPVGRYTWRYLADYASVRPMPEREDEPVFLTTRGEPHAVDPETVSGDMRDLLVALGLAGAGDDAGYELYTMRKTFAHRAAQGGMDVGELAAIMGHSTNSIPMLLERYYSPSDEQKRVAHAAARPADSLHEGRAEVRHGQAFAAPRPPSFFERWAAPRRDRRREQAVEEPASRSLIIAA